MTAETKHKYMLETPMYKLITSMAIPTICSMIVTSLYSLADTYYVSKLGTYATGAIGINSSIDNIIMMLGSFIAAGATSYISRLLGAKKNEHANRVISTAYFTAVGCGILIMIFGLLFTEELVVALGATENLVKYSVDYATYIFLAAPLMSSNFILSHSLRSEGNALLSMIGMMSSAVVNIILDPIFIFDLGLGVAGASMATAISKVFSFVILLMPYIRRRRTILRISIRKISYTKDVVPEILRMGSPSLLRAGLNTVSAVILNKIAAGYSESALAAISLCHRIMMFPFGICMGFSQGYSPVSGYSVGARRFDRAREALRAAMVISVGSTIVLGALIFIFSEQVIGLFTETDASLLRLGEFSLRLQCVALPLHAGVAVVNFFCSSRGKPIGAAILGTARQGICFFPILPIMVAVWGEWGVASVQAVADALTLIPAIPILLIGLREMSRLEAEDKAAAAANTAEATLPQ